MFKHTNLMCMASLKNHLVGTYIGIKKKERRTAVTAVGVVTQ